MEHVIERIKEHKIIAIVRGVALDDIVPTAHALMDGGIRLLEVTFNQSSSTGEQDTAEAIRRLCSAFGDDMIIGAGTVVSERQVAVAVEAGAQYIISPNTDAAVIRKTLELGAVSIPGALTPTEVLYAHNLGAHFVKLFPAGNLGTGYIKAIRAPISHIPLLAVGGVNDKNLMDFFKAGVSGVGVGANIVDNKLIKEKKFDELTALARLYTSQL
ncbi:MAG: bifunctional 4-hydroxy-2-oxoglutarate aldolase/2-dehydro-3-deoxy-phosphogluconate aldolase [Christensenellaceae bacterium]|nr:bifunctional 4-hydroxy-2-oxoglutarate aldolase/2-dehydro-3-deoxy-phosphogluconate aldolase [Christensenellaceae bacterium]